MKKFLIYLTIFFAVFIGTATCIIVDGYNSYQANKANETTAINLQQNNSVLTSLASNVLGLKQFGGSFTLTDNNSTNLSGTFALQNNNGQTIDVTLTGTCETFPVNASIQYFGDNIYINFNGSKIKLSTDDISTGLEAVKVALASLTDTIETASSSELPELSTDYLMQFLDKIKTTETESGIMMELSIPNLCDLYLLTDKDLIPSQILVNNIHLGSNVFSLNVRCDKTHTASKINYDEYISVSPVMEYIKPTLLALADESVGLYGQINFNGSIIFVNATIKNQNKISGQLRFGNATANFELKNDYLLVEFYGKVFKITLEDLQLLLNSDLLRTAQTTDEINTYPTITPTVKDGKLSRIEITGENISGSLDIGKSYFDSISIDESNTKSLKDLISVLNNFKSIIANEYSLNIDFEQNDIKINGRAYVVQSNLNIEKLYFSGDIIETPVTIIYENKTAFCNVDGIKFSLSNQSIENIFNIVLSTTENSQNYQNAIDLTSLAELNFINNIDFTTRSITFSSDQIDAKLTSYSGFFKASIAAGDIQIQSTIYTDSAYKSIAKNLVKSEYKDYSELSDLASATINTIKENYIHYNGNISIDIFDCTVENVGIDVEIFKNERRIEIELSNLPTNSLLTYLNSIYYTTQNCHLTITDSYVKIYTTTRVLLTGKEVIISNRTIPLSEFSTDNLYDIMSLRNIYIKEIKKATNKTHSSPTIDITSDILDINKDESILTLTKFVENFASDLTIKIQHKNQIENISAQLNIHNLINFEINLNKVN